MDTPLTFTVPAGASASCTSTLAVASPASELDAIPSSTGAAVHPMHIPLPESSLDMHGHPALSLSPTRHPLSLDIDAANTCSPNTSRRLPPSSTTPAAHGPATPVSAFSTLSSTHHQHPPHTPSLFSMQYTGRSHLFGAALHPEFLASVDLTEEVLGIGSQAVVLRGTLRPGHPQAGMPVAVKFIFRSRGMARQVRQAFEASGLAELGGHGGGGGSASSTSSSSGGTGGGSDTSSPPPILDMHYELTPQSPRIKETPTEIRVLSTLSHPNLIRYIAHFTDATFYYLILELAGPLVAWSECVADHAWNTEAPQRGFGDAMSAPASPRLGSRSMSSVSLASLAAALSPANALAPMGGMAPPALAHRGSTSLTLPESAATAAAMWSELALLASPAVTSPVHESFASYLSNELELPPLPLWKTSRDLFECLDRFGPFCEDRGRMVFAQLVDVVAYLHANNICHRDLKDENILINDRLEIKLIDFGSATTLDSKQHGSFGTECYNAPEAVKSERKPCTRHTSKSSLSSSSSTAAAAAACPLCYDAAKAECWALGVVLYVMLNVSTPYDSAADSLVLPAKPYRRPLSEPVKTVISRLLRREPEKRWGIKDVQESKWLKGVKPLLPMASGASAGGGGVDPAHVKNALGLVAEQHCGGAFSR